MQKSVKRMEMAHHKKLMAKKGHKPLFDTPDYLKAFAEPQKLGDLHSLARSILEGTFDDKAEDQRIHKVVYQHLPNHRKLNYRSKYLQGVPLEELGHKTERKLKKIDANGTKPGPAVGLKYASAGMLDQNQQSNLLAHLSAQPDFPRNIGNSGAFDPNAARTHFDNGSITTELRETKQTFEMGSHLNDTTTVGAEVRHEQHLQVPSSARVSRRGSSAGRRSLRDSINASSFDGSRGKSQIDPEPEYRREQQRQSKANSKDKGDEDELPKIKKKSPPSDAQASLDAWKQLSLSKAYRQRFASLDETPVNIRTNVPHAGTTVGYEFTGD